MLLCTCAEAVYPAHHIHRQYGAWLACWAGWVLAEVRQQAHHDGSSTAPPGCPLVQARNGHRHAALSRWKRCGMKDIRSAGRNGCRRVLLLPLAGELHRDLGWGLLDLLASSATSATAICLRSDGAETGITHSAVEAEDAADVRPARLLHPSRHEEHALTAQQPDSEFRDYPTMPANFPTHNMIKRGDSGDSRATGSVHSPAVINEFNKANTSALLASTTTRRKAFTT